ncbi:MAG: aconitase X catalytic domain-containing protein [Limnochordia bacterium]
MQLTDLEKRMLDGEYGEAASLAMSVLVELGRSFDAEGLVEITASHIQGMYMCLHDAGLEWLEKLAALGGRVRVPSTSNPSSICFAPDCGVDYPQDWIEKQYRFKNALVSLGVQPTWTCTPYFVGNIPRVGQNVAFAESSAVSFANSVLGARTERMGAGTEICAALTGRNIGSGLYLDENRIGTALVDVQAGIKSTLDYFSIGYVVGKELSDEVPVIKGIPSGTTGWDELKSLGAAAAVSGNIALYHVLGVTPEAIHRDPFQGRKPKQVITITDDDLRAVEEELTTAASGADPDVVAVGCPHYSVPQMIYLSDLLKNRKVKPGVRFWVHTTLDACQMIKDMGRMEIFERAGVTVLPQSCMNIAPLHHYKVNCIMTDSAKYGYYLPSEYPGASMIYAPTEQCVLRATKVV